VFNSRWAQIAFADTLGPRGTEGLHTDCSWESLSQEGSVTPVGAVELPYVNNPSLPSIRGGKEELRVLGIRVGTLS